MADTLASLKKASSNLEELSSKLNKQINPRSASKSFDDDRFWYPAVDAAGNGGAVIRFLPPPVDEDSPCARVFSHRFQGPTKAWYSEKSLTTLGEKDPCGEYNSELWNTNIEANQNQARDQKRKLTIYSNIYVVKDPLTPENEGKVFLYRYGTMIWKMIDRAIAPPDLEDPEVQEQIKSGMLDEDEIRDAFNPFDPWEGANFRMKIKTVGGFRKYDGENGSKFLKNETLFKDDKDLDKVWKAEHSLAAFMDPGQFKSYDELKTKLQAVLGLNEDIPEMPEPKLSTVEDQVIPEVKVEDDDIDLSFLDEVEEDETV
jgi:hypothetical protein